MNFNFINIANLIGSHIVKTAHRSKELCNWISKCPISGKDKSKIVYKSLGADIYNGTSGIALFLAQLYIYTSEKIYQEIAIAAIKHALSRVDAIPSNLRFSFYTGNIGIAYVTLYIGLLFDNKQLISEGRNIIYELAKDYNSEHLMDVISGNAGAIPALLELFSLLKDNKVLDMAIQLGEELLSVAIKETKGWSWDNRINSIESLHNLLGFAHGASGIGHALQELFYITNEPKFAAGAVQAFEYEDNWYSEEYNNWPDFRLDYYSHDEPNKSLVYSTAWCHGAIGIGLARLRAYNIFKKEHYLKLSKNVLDSIQKSIKRIDTSNNTNDISLCHGISGAWDLLLYGSYFLKDLSYYKTASETAQQATQNFVDFKTTWAYRDEVSSSITPGLMIGLSGIGYCCLRLSHPFISPSIGTFLITKC